MVASTLERTDLDTLRDFAIPFDGSRESLDPLLDIVGDAHVVLIGEATHGTHEFYATRAELTKRLIAEKGFQAVAVEADWPDAYRVNRYVRGKKKESKVQSPKSIVPGVDAGPRTLDSGRGTRDAALDALGDFQRFPLWMWRNTVVLDFVDWLRRHNDALPYERRAGFYGIDLYSLYSSAAAVIAYLDGVDPAAAQRARDRYGCFETFEDDPQRYGYAASFGFDSTCEDAAVQQLAELRNQAQHYLSRDGFVAEDELFYAQQNALLVQNAERYYREMFRGRVNTWNLRDSHMADTLINLRTHLSRQSTAPGPPTTTGTTGHPAKIVVWEHNSHLGDARATSMGRIGEHNVGQLVREKWGREAVLIGFTTYHGTVTAADNWDEPARLKKVTPALTGSFEALFHDTGRGDFILDLRGGPVAELLRDERLERAIGVIYRPQTERASHYFECRLSDQFDAVIHLDRTRALEPLDPTSTWNVGEAKDETYPFGV